jgi:hypothetical protein
MDMNSYVLGVYRRGPTRYGFTEGYIECAKENWKALIRYCDDENPGIDSYGTKRCRLSG